MTREEKENLRIAKKLASKHLRREGHKKILAKYESGMGKIGTGAGKAASGFQKQVIEGKGRVVVRGGTVYPRARPKYVRGRKNHITANAKRPRRQNKNIPGKKNKGKI